mmetsp:Transcript_1979/g.3715  ORF Transcript_1979/g.3715 Transcript_1979/m.3715 type:complete len:389 (+) Transcript_1979:558-1724(+)
MGSISTSTSISNSSSTASKKSRIGIRIMIVVIIIIVVFTSVNNLVATLVKDSNHVLEFCRDCLGFPGSIEQDHDHIASREVSRPHLDGTVVAIVGVFVVFAIERLGRGPSLVALDAEWILVNGNHFLVGNNVPNRFGNRSQIVGQQQRCFHQTPHRKVGPLFVNGQTSTTSTASAIDITARRRCCRPHLQHVGIVPSPRTRIGMPFVVFVDDVHDRFPIVSNVSGGPPGISPDGSGPGGRVPDAPLAEAKQYRAVSNFTVGSTGTACICCGVHQCLVHAPIPGLNPAQPGCVAIVVLEIVDVPASVRCCVPEFVAQSTRSPLAGHQSGIAVQAKFESSVLVSTLMCIAATFTITTTTTTTTTIYCYIHWIEGSIFTINHSRPTHFLIQ